MTIRSGSVYLVGAGPGDPGLITVRGMELLRRADVVIHDRLIGAPLLDAARPDAILIDAGKAPGAHRLTQDQINDAIVAHARYGHAVVRLKGGDPFVFGRGGEEALTLVAHGVPFRVVPGISAGLGGLAYAGIPLTHRGINHAVTFLTGHDSGGVVPDAIDWHSISKGSPVIVMYMAMKHWPVIRAKLLEGGRRDDEPVAFVCDATTGTQRVLETTLGNSVTDLEASGLQPPAIVVVGKAVAMRAGLDWLGALQGRKLDPDPLHERGERDAG